MHSRCSHAPALVLVALLTACGAQSDSAPEAEATLSVVPVAEASVPAFTIREPDLLPENVAFDPATGDYFVGSTRKGKILRVHDGVATEFVAPRDHGLWMVIGMKVDAARRTLWVCSSDGGNLEDRSQGIANGAGLFRFDLESGELLERWLLTSDDDTHFLNDVVVTERGEAFVTHMFDQHAIYRATPGGEFALWIELPPETYPNGLALDDSEEALYVATSVGILRVDVTSGAIDTVSAGEGVPSTGVDGLYWNAGSLVGVRPDAMEVRRYDLSPDGLSIEASVVLDTDHPDYEGPTTGVLIGDTLVYVANAQFDRYSETGLENLVDPVILKLGVR